MNLEKWIADYVVKLNLCPFAAGTLKQNKWQLHTLDFKDYKALEQLLTSFLNEDLEEIETYFLKSAQLEKWDEFLFYFHLLEEITTEVEIFQSIKVVGFHPEYRHAGIDDENVHFSNRSPWPLIQLLNTDDVHKRTAQVDVAKVLEENELTLNKTSLIELEKILNDCK